MLAGAGGFEPPHGGIKIRCLTAWLRPKLSVAGRSRDSLLGPPGVAGNNRHGSRRAKIRLAATGASLSLQVHAHSYVGASPDWQPRTELAAKSRQVGGQPMNRCAMLRTPIKSVQDGHGTS
jgi:hypothetical protein